MSELSNDTLSFACFFADWDTGLTGIYVRLFGDILQTEEYPLSFREIYTIYTIYILYIYSMIIGAFKGEKVDGKDERFNRR